MKGIKNATRWTNASPRRKQIRTRYVDREATGSCSDVTTTPAANFVSWRWYDNKAFLLSMYAFCNGNPDDEKDCPMVRRHGTILPGVEVPPPPPPLCSCGEPVGKAKASPTATSTTDKDRRRIEKAINFFRIFRASGDVEKFPFPVSIIMGMMVFAKKRYGGGSIGQRCCLCTNQEFSLSPSSHLDNEEKQRS
eukprot:scaffold34921_cov162-Amphora_coffeaeformis.AAC.7